MGVYANCNWWILRQVTIINFYHFKHTHHFYTILMLMPRFSCWQDIPVSEPVFQCYTIANKHRNDYNVKVCHIFGGRAYEELI